MSFILVSFVLVMPARSGEMLPVKDLLTEKQIEKLAKIIKANTPENPRYQGTKPIFIWVCLTLDKDIQPDLRDAIVKVFSGHYEVYLNRQDVPAERADRDNPFRTGGFYFDVRIKFVENNLIEVSYSDRESMEAGSSFSIKYSWNGEEWVVVWKAPVALS